MRVKYLILLLFVFAISSCKKQTIPPSLEGTWELRYYSGGMSRPTILPANNGNLLGFSGNTYTLIKNNQTIKKNSYSIISDAGAENETCSALPANEFKNRIEFHDSTISKIYFQVTADTLIFLSGCAAYDANTYSKYIRKF